MCLTLNRVISDTGNKPAHIFAIFTTVYSLRGFRFAHKYWPWPKTYDTK